MAWVDRIFTKLTVRYGDRFLNRWRGIDMDAVRNDWADTLAGFDNWPEAIAYAFEHLDDDKPPTAANFRTLAHLAPKPERLALPEPKADPARVAAELAKLGHLPGPAPSKQSGHGMRDWAYRLKTRHDAGEILSLNQIRCYTDALGAAA